MANVSLILLIIGFVAAALAAAWTQEFRSVHLGWAAVALYLLSLILGAKGL
jgi:hypothetical protein